MRQVDRVRKTRSYVGDCGFPRSKPFCHKTGHRALHHTFHANKIIFQRYTLSNGAAVKVPSSVQCHMC